MMTAAASPAASGGARRRRGLSLRSKGLLAFATIMAYLVAVLALSTREHQTHEHYVADIEGIAEAESEVSMLADALDHLERVLGAAVVEAKSGNVAVGDIPRRTGEALAALADLRDEFPDMESFERQLARGLADLVADPSHTTQKSLWDDVQHIEDRMHGVSAALAGQRAKFKAEYLEEHEHLIRVALAHVLLGAIIFGTIIFLFVHGLTRDIRTTEELAAQVASGYRGRLAAVTRRDELGRLMQSIANMKAALQTHEQTAELARELRFHQEKMAAVGWMAAAVAHEINNPIAAIAGIARDMLESETRGPASGGESNFGGPRMILAQTERISAISRQIAEFSSAPLTEPDLFDLNAVVRNTCTFVGYDRRLGGVQFELDLDPSLPAVFGVADHVTQVLINLVVNSADALEGITDRKPTIRVATRHDHDQATLTVADNGHGMDASVQARAFEEMFTTKPASRGRGLGLFLCRSLVERDGGQIGLTSTAGVGTSVSVHLPLLARAS